MESRPADQYATSARIAEFAWRYGLAIFTVVVCTTCRVLLFAIDEGRTPFIVFFPAVLASALFGGVGPGIVATCLSAIVVSRWMSEHGKLFIGVNDLLIVCMFLAVSAVLIALCQAFRRTRQTSRTAMAALEISEKRFRMLCESAPVGIALSRRGTILYANPAYRRMYGYPDDTTMVGSSVLDQVAPSHRAVVAENIRRRYDGEPIATQYELMGIRTDGTEFPYVVNVGRVEMEGGMATIAFTSDITANRKAQIALSRSESQHRAFFEIASVGLSQAEWGNGHLMRVNDRFCAITGYSRAELVGMNVYSLTHPNDRAREAAAYQRLIDGHANYYELEKRFVRRDGSTVWVHVNITAVRDSDGRPVCTAGVIQDISDRKRIEQERENLLARERAARAAAEHASQVKDQFLAALSHELRTPLTPVLLTTSMLEEHADLPQEIKDDIAAIRRNVELEARLIDDLLDLTRVSRGKFQLHREIANAHTLLHNAAEVCRPSPGGNIVLNLHASHTSVNVDPARFQQVFWNLLNNAKKFTPDTGTITVTTTNPAPEALRVQVTDTGAGIDPALLPTIFDAFVQGAASNRPRQGLGLGLAICRAIVNALGGTISATSAGPGRGATFTVDMPTVQHAPVDGGAQPSSSSGPTDSTLKTLSILLVEDNEPTLNVMHRLLVSMGHKVSPATTIRHALALAEKEKPDLLVSDLGLPDGTGYELMQQLRARFNVTGVALSGYGMEDDIKKSLDAGFSEHLTKPIDLPRLKECLDRCGAPRA